MESNWVAQLVFPLRESSGYTPLIAAVTANLPKMTRYLIEKCRADVNVCAETGCTALFYATEMQDKETMNLLHDFKADPNLSSSSTAKLPLHAAAELGSVELVQLLLSWGALVNLTVHSAKDKREITALDIAIAVRAHTV